MYDPGAEHDACGVGMVTTLNKRPERKIIDDAIEVLVNLNHRGAVGAEENTGDGAGILMSMPDEFMRATAGVELPEEGHYAAGIAFLDRDIATSGQQEQAIAKIVREEGLEVLAWRVVPTNPDGLGLQALASMPAFKTLVVADPEGQLAGIELDRKTFRIRKRVEHEVGIYFASLSARTITYKGMLTTMQLTHFFEDLNDERMKATIAIVTSGGIVPFGNPDHIAASSAQNYGAYDLDGVTDLVDGEQAGVSTFHEGADELIGAETEGRKLRAILVQGVQQVAVFVSAVLCAHSDQAIGFLGVDVEVFHQGRRSPGALADIVVEHVPQVEAGGSCPLQSFASQVAGLLRRSQTVSHIGEVVAEVLRVDVFDAFAERVQLGAGRPGCC